ncbi:MAG: hypothetical protein ACRD1Z_00830 [Vicinamibacteria bacterium]
MQPIVLDEHGVARFKENSLVRYLVDWSTDKGLGLNGLAMLPKIPREDWEQLAQLIGYSVSGASDLSYMSDEVIKAADCQVERLLVKKKMRLK